MKVIIIGGGQVGMYMADLLERNKCEYVIIEENRSRAKKLKEKYGETHVILGNGTSPTIL